MKTDEIVDPEDLNPFVAALPARIGKMEQFEMLRVLPRWDERERLLPHVERRHRVLRLLDYMEPLNQQLDLVERFDMAIRQGYRGRDPSTLSYRRSLIESADDIAAGRDPLAHPGVRVVENGGSRAVYAEGDPCAPRMPGFAVIGCPGMGKSATMERILHNYPLIVVHHGTADLITQIPWLKLECPSMGSRKSFCIEFFRLLDERLEQEGKLATRYGNPSRTVDAMLADVQHLVRLHAIGVLVVDEIQNLRASKEGIEPLVNFLVAMANKIGVGIITIGTMAAMQIPQAAFHSARRASGLGSFVWDPMRPGEEWDAFIETMWRYQWTSVAAPLDDGVKAALYEHSQGVVDIVIKLFVLAQLRVITNAELGEVEEIITPEVIEAVAEDDLVMIAPMIEALRSRDLGQLERFEDLKPFHEFFGGIVSRATGMDVQGIRERLRAEEAAERARAANVEDERRQMYVEMLKSFGVDDAEDAIDAILELFDPADVVAIGRAIADAAKSAGATAGRGSKRGRRKAAEHVAVAGDLREMLAARNTGTTMHAAMREAGVARTPLEAIAR